MQAKFSFTVEINDENVNTSFSADKIEDMDITKSMTLLKAFNDQQKRIKNLLSREATNSGVSNSNDSNETSPEKELLNMEDNRNEEDC